MYLKYFLFKVDELQPQTEESCHAEAEPLGTNTLLSPLVYPISAPCIFWAIGSVSFQPSAASVPEILQLCRMQRKQSVFGKG